MAKILLVFLIGLPLVSAFGQSPDSASAAVAKPRVNLYVETARPLQQINAVYPYDIGLRTASGDTLNSASVFAKNGKPTVLMFWLTTCMPCRYELTAIAGKFEAWQKEADFNLYAISVDFPKNFEQFVKRVDESHWPFPAYYDLNREFRLVLPGELNGLPQVFVLDGAGNIVHHTRKYRPGDEDALFEAIKSAR